MHELEPTKVIAWVFYALVSGCGTVGLIILNEMRKDIAGLNIKMASIINNDEWYKKQFSEQQKLLENHEGRLDSHGTRIVRLEERDSSKRKRTVTNFEAKDS